MFFFFLMTASFAQYTVVSPYRDPQRDWQTYAYSIESKSKSKKLKIPTPSRRAVSWSDFDSDAVKKMNLSRTELQEMFFFIRDQRFFLDPQSQGFKRRIPWMYPDNGCPIRAEWVVRKLKEKYENVELSKVFIFGNLSMQTEYHPDGEVTWWYHVAPGVNVSGEVYILDPAASFERPFKLQEWIDALGGAFGVKLSVCEPGTLDVWSDCTLKKNPYQNTSLLNQLTLLLKYERSRVNELGYRSRDVLGETPPWLNRSRR